MKKKKIKVRKLWNINPKTRVKESGKKYTLARGSVRVNVHYRDDDHGLEDRGDVITWDNVNKKVVLTGKKWDQKRYTWTTGYQGLRSETARTRFERQPELILTEAVRRMLPKNKLATKMLDKLKVYTGATHPHQAQNPEPKELAVKAKKK